MIGQPVYQKSTITVNTMVSSGIRLAFTKSQKFHLKASDASCVMTDCFEEISGSISRKKALETGKCSVV